MTDEDWNAAAEALFDAIPEAHASEPELQMILWGSAVVFSRDVITPGRYLVTEHFRNGSFCRLTHGWLN